MKSVPFISSDPFMVRSCMILLIGIAFFNNTSAQNKGGGEGGLTSISAHWREDVPFDLKISLDWAKTVEKGNSAFAYNAKTRENLLMYVTVIPGNPFTEPSEGGSKQLMAGNNNLLFDYDRQTYTPSPVKKGAFAIGMGLGWVGKGAKFENGDFTLDYIELPIHASYYMELGPGIAFGGLGPYFAYGIGGKFSGGESSFGEDAGGYKRFDWGLSFILGYRFGPGFVANIGYDLGLANIAYASEDVTSHNRCFKIEVGYNIGRLFKK